MRLILLCCLTFCSSCVHSKEDSFTGSTPAGEVVRKFLNISLADSVDFIRWKLTIDENKFQLTCTYGIGKPNTNGFIGGGSKIVMNGGISKQQFFYTLVQKGGELKLFELNENLFHLADSGGRLLVGNSGWSYTLNSLSPKPNKVLNIISQTTTLEDSSIVEGRTPCGIPGILRAGANCYKLKWKIVLYANSTGNVPTTYKIYGTAWREKGIKAGRWKIQPGSNGRHIYRLNDENDQPFLSLLKIDENIFVFLDESEKPLVGDEDFSYTLNRRL